MRKEVTELIDAANKTIVACSRYTAHLHHPGPAPANFQNPLSDMETALGRLDAAADNTGAKLESP